MPLAIPPELKKISPFVRRAEELDRDKTSAESRLVAYYCRQYAVHTGIPLASSSSAAKTCLGHLLEQLEKEKPAMDNFTRDESAFLCRKFATGVFDKADQEDRQGLASKNTAKAFYAAANFLQVLEQFEEEGSERTAEDKKKIIYAKWKATEILKALKEGRTPTPGGYGEDEAEDENDPEEDQEEGKKVDASPAVEVVVVDDDSDKDQAFDIPIAPPKPIPPPVARPPPPMPSPPPEQPLYGDSDDDGDNRDENEAGQEIELDPPPAYPGAGNVTMEVDKPKLTFQLPSPETAPTAPPKKSGGFFGFGSKKQGGKASKAQITDALELTRFALAALEDRDADLAAERLQQALAALGR